MIKPLTVLGTVLFSASLSAAVPSATPSTGNWKVVGNVQGVAVNLNCLLVEADDHTLSGSCVDEASKAHPVTGTVKDLAVNWQFNSEYEGTPIKVSMSGTLDAAGGKMAGTIAVDPLAADGDFTAVLQPSTPTT